MTASTPSPSAHPVPRRATEADVPALAALWALAFPGERTAETRARELLDGGPWGGFEDAWVVTSPNPDGAGAARLDGAFRALPLTLRLFGQAIPALGVAAVAVAPHARRQGLGAHLCRAALRVGRDRGDLVSLLYPFRGDFYARLGFAFAGELHRYRFPPEALPLFPGAERVEVLECNLAQRLLPELYEARLPASHGLVHRTPARWAVLLPAHALALGIRGPDGGWSGYMLGSVRALSRGQGQEFRVAEFLVDGPETYRAGLGWISAQRDAWRRVTLDALPGERLHHVLAHPQLPGTSMTRSLWFPSATVLRGPMMRILDAPALFAALGADSEALPRVLDPLFGGGLEADPDAGVPAPPALPVGVASSLLAQGELPGLRLPRPGFAPDLGIPDFRLLDAF